MAPTDPSSSPHQSRLLRLAGRPQNDFVEISYRPDAETTEGIRDDLELLGLSKVTLNARLVPAGRQGWDLSGDVGATVTQPCAVTSEPVRTRIDVPFLRRFRTEVAPPPAGGEVEMPEDDTLEPLTGTVDLGAILAEEISLALPLFPRAPGAELGTARFTEEGKTPMSDEDARPFAGLAGLRAALREDGDPEDR